MAVVPTLCPERRWQCWQPGAVVAGSLLPVPLPCCAITAWAAWLCRVNGLHKALTAPALCHPGEKSMHVLISLMRIMGRV